MDDATGVSSITFGNASIVCSIPLGEFPLYNTTGVSSTHADDAISMSD